MKSQKNSENEEVRTIVNKAIELGFVCQLTKEKMWKIYLRNNWSLFQSEGQWLLIFETLPEFYISNEKVLKILTGQT